MTPTDIEALHAAIVPALEAQFPEFAAVEAYAADLSQVALPACALKLTAFEMAPGEDPGTEQLPMFAIFEARLVETSAPADAELAVRKKAADLATFVHRQRWGLAIGEAEVTAVEPVEEELSGRLQWRVLWRHLGHFGSSVWAGTGELPDTLLVSWEPETGVLHEPDYMELVSPEGAE